MHCASSSFPGVALGGSSCGRRGHLSLSRTFVGRPLSSLRVVRRRRPPRAQPTPPLLSRASSRRVSPQKGLCLCFAESAAGAFRVAARTAVLWRICSENVSHPPASSNRILTHRFFFCTIHRHPTPPQVASSQRDPDVRAAATDIAKLQRIMRAVAPKMDDLAEAAELAAMLDLASAELSSGEPVTQAKDLAAEAAVALSAAFDWLGSAGPVRVIRSPEARLMWVSLFGMDEMAPFDAFSERLVGYLKEAFPNGDPKQVRALVGRR